MKAIDFTKPGGFPLTQDQMGYLQTAWQEVADQLLGLGVNNSSPAILSGMVSSTSGATVTVSDGWFVYNGQAVNFAAQTYTTPVTSGDAVYIVVTPSATPLTFNDGSAPDVVLDSTGVLTILSDTTAIDTTHFLLASLVPFGVGLAMNNRDAAFTTITVSTPAADGGVVGSIYYKKDWAANTLHLKGFLAAGNANNFAASPTYAVKVMGILPIGYYPTLIAGNFTAQTTYGSRFFDDTGVVWIDILNGFVDTAGNINIEWLKPATVTHYNCVFNVTIPLD